MLTRGIGFCVSPFSDDRFLVRRPYFLEYPKLFIVLMCFGAMLFFLFLYIVFGYYQKSFFRQKLGLTELLELYL